MLTREERGYPGSADFGSEQSALMTSRNSQRMSNTKITRPSGRQIVPASLPRHEHAPVRDRCINTLLPSSFPEVSRKHVLIHRESLAALKRPSAAGATN
jgi:hypothetical protein